MSSRLHFKLPSGTNFSPQAQFKAHTRKRRVCPFVFYCEESSTDLSLGRELDHRLPEVKLGVGVSHFLSPVPPPAALDPRPHRVAVKEDNLLIRRSAALRL